MNISQAIRDDEIETVKKCIAAGADVNAPDEYGETPLQLAANWCNRPIMELLISEGADVDGGAGGYTPLYITVSSGAIEDAKFLISKGADLNTRDKYQRTPLHLASFRGRLTFVELLISEGANVNARDQDGHSPLDLAELE